jgi:hypothetical protein
VTIDGCGSSLEGGDAFTWETAATCEVKKWITSDRFVLFEGECRGFGAYQIEASHNRSVFFIKEGLWAVRDRIKADSAKRIEARFHFAESVSATVEDFSDGKLVVSRADDEVGLDLISSSGDWSVENDTISPWYGKYVETRTAVLRIGPEDCSEFLTLLVPVSLPESQVKKYKTTSNAIEIERGGKREFVVSSGATAPSGFEGGFEGAFEWLWARIDAESGMLEEFVVTNCRELSFDGRVLVAESERLEFAVGSLRSGRLIVKTSKNTGTAVEVVRSSKNRLATSYA